MSFCSKSNVILHIILEFVPTTAKQCVNLHWNVNSRLIADTEKKRFVCIKLAYLLTWLKKTEIVAGVALISMTITANVGNTITQVLNLFYSFHTEVQQILTLEKYFAHQSSFNIYFNHKNHSVCSWTFFFIFQSI